MSEKTNAMRILNREKIPYTHRFWADATAQNTGVELALALREDPKRVFKTLVTVGKTGAHYVFLLPVEMELDLKKGAAAVGEKSIAMCKAKELFPLTGYVHGGCSPIGMKRAFPTTIHITAEQYPTILFSAGKIGHQLEVALSDLKKVLPFALKDVAVKI